MTETLGRDVVERLENFLLERAGTIPRFDEEAIRTLLAAYEVQGKELERVRGVLVSISEPDQSPIREAVETGDPARIIQRLTEVMNIMRGIAMQSLYPQCPDGSICTACEHPVSDHNLQRATNKPPVLCRRCAIVGDICGGGVFRGPDPSDRRIREEQGR